MEKELFEKEKLDNMPLSARLAPQSLSDFAGQEHILGAGKLLRRLIEADRVRSALFYGPPGTGKTALAKFIAGKTNAKTYELNAAVAGIAELKQILSYAKENNFSGGRVLLVLDEIHHFNRTQQDVLLPSVERGEIILIGLTAENPFFYINHALISRFNVFEFRPLSDDNLLSILGNAVGRLPALGYPKTKISDEVKKHFVVQSSGDARRLLNSLELAVLTVTPENGEIDITIDAAKEIFQTRPLRYDKSDDEHYDQISAFIKSMRGSDPDAALYWMAKMLSSGEDPRFIARRILICAAEDVGLADPLALLTAEAAFKSAEVLGMPEARIPLAMAAVYVAGAPKSNSAYLAIAAATEEVKNGKNRQVPKHLRSGGKNEGYLYAHDYPGHFVKQEYMPDKKIFYSPTDEGREAAIAKRIKELRKK